MYQIEEINIVHNGGNYGFMKREGYWENGRWRGGALGESRLFPRLPSGTRVALCKPGHASAPRHKGLKQERLS